MTARFRSKTIANATLGLTAAAWFAAASPALAQNPAESGARPAAAPTAPAPTPAATPAKPPAGAGATGNPSLPAGITPPPDYVIGAEDVLSVVFWKDKDMTTDVTVRPDGKITLPLVDDVMAAGLTPTQLRERIAEESKRFIEDPSVNVVVKAINSRKVYIQGEIGKPGPYALTGPMTILQLITLAGGLREFADGDKIQIIRNEKSGPRSILFSYKDVANRKAGSLQTNIELKPGDTIIVP